MYPSIFAVAVCALLSECIALNCRTESGPKEDELKSVFRACVMKMEGKSNESRHGMDRESSIRGMDRMDQSPYNRDNTDQVYGKNDRNSNRNPDGMNVGSSQSDESTSEHPKFNSYRLTTTPTRRYRRERTRNDNRGNSGHRSQYNPNTSQRPGNTEDSYGNDYRYNTSDSKNNMSMSAKSKTCIAHCFLDDMHMTGDNGMPDRYMVTNVITKDIKNEDLKDFLQESIEECFQILYNENTQDKCAFSKNLMLCLSEKGRANCDDWKEDDLHF